MQLKDKKLGQRLALATTALLGTQAPEQALAGDGDWKVDSALLYYAEDDDRVKAVEPVISLTREFEDESALNLRIVYDSLTGSSPNGAAIANVAQTFTSASAAARLEGADEEEQEEYAGRGSYTINPGDVPLDPSFEDSRTVLSAGWTQPWGDDYTLSVGGAYSSEEDFTSMSGNVAIARDLNNNNTTLSLGVNLEFDTIEPNGGIPQALGSLSEHNTDGSDDTKQVVDMMFGVTQVINRRWITQLNFGLSQSSGYQNDPYKILTVVDNGNLITDPNDSERYLYVFENRPEDRQKLSLYWQNKFAIGSNDVIDIGYRYMTDDWDVNSHTLDLTYHWQPLEHFYLEPHYRYYTQTAADFYEPFLNAGSEVDISGTDVTALVNEASSDPRLAAFSANTFGVKAGFPLRQDEEISVRLEYYQQQDDNSTKAVGAGSDLDGMSQFTELKASWIQVGYSFRW
ncbi:MAG: hypothetical protein CMI02_05375 [Oceanospirillaceae bacterium]|nr:hypothetical protein [Oceanospirillaceae bacterium]MBT11449.1 hypothetical protein [Oceanospirillaceae bacterium]|tara:strand:+ start:137768 stop:139138 length:1371 start_codon:yes stop_codon:yes gene_type:complete